MRLVANLRYIIEVDCTLSITGIKCGPGCGIHFILMLYKTDLASDFIQNKRAIVLYDVERVTTRIGHLVPIRVMNIVVIVNILDSFFHLCTVDIEETRPLILIRMEINLAHHFTSRREGINVLFIRRESQGCRVN